MQSGRFRRRRHFVITNRPLRDLLACAAVFLFNVDKNNAFEKDSLFTGRAKLFLHGDSAVLVPNTPLVA